jgi:adhesin transport system membrane fusion protein
MENNTSDPKINQLRYLSQSALIEEKADLGLVRKTLFIISISVLILIAWATVIMVEEVATAKGNIVPTKNIQLVQHLEGGIISDIKVKEGELVKKGDILMTLDGSSAESDLDSLNLRKTALEYRSLRLRALIDNVKPQFTIDESNADSKALAEEQLKIYETALKAREDEREIIQEQIKQKASLIEGLTTKQKSYDDNLKLVQEENKIKENLYKSGNVSKFQYIQAQKQLNSIIADMEDNKSAVEQANSSLVEYRNRLEFLDSNFMDRTYDQLNQTETELSQTKEAIDKYQDRVNRLEIRAPIDGYIKVLNIKTLGGVVEAGKILAEIVPLEGGLIAEIHINPRDIGYISLGQKAKVKISTYDYSKFGTLEGELTYISASAFENEQGERYYMGRVSLKKNYFGEDSTKNVVIAGMVAQVDIITGSSSIISYLLQPIYKSVDSSFSKR